MAEHDLTLHGPRRSFDSPAEWTETSAGIVAQIMGHKPSVIAEKHYRRRPIDLLRIWHIKIEEWILAQAAITFAPTEPGLRAASSRLLLMRVALRATMRHDYH
jgi:hypothetical protein